MHLWRTMKAVWMEVLKTMTSVKPWPKRSKPMTTLPHLQLELQALRPTSTMICEVADMPIAAIPAEPPDTPHPSLQNQQTSNNNRTNRTEDTIHDTSSALASFVQQESNDICIQPNSLIPVLINRDDSDSDNEAITKTEETSYTTSSITIQGDSHQQASLTTNRYTTSRNIQRLTRQSQQATQFTQQRIATTPLVPSQVITQNHWAPNITIEGLAQIQASGHTTQNNFGIGDPLQLPKPVTSLRVYFQNVNGINLTSQGIGT